MKDVECHNCEKRGVQYFITEILYTQYEVLHTWRRCGGLGGGCHRHGELATGSLLKGLDNDTEVVDVLDQILDVLRTRKGRNSLIFTQHLSDEYLITGTNLANLARIHEIANYVQT